LLIAAEDAPQPQENQGFAYLARKTGRLGILYESMAYVSAMEFHSVKNSHVEKMQRCPVSVHK
jgi:hypothetical protein